MQQKEITQSPSTSTITLVTSTQSSPLVTSSGSTSTLASSVSADLPIATASADVAADIAKYTSKVSAGGTRGGGVSEDPHPDGSRENHDLAGFPGCLGGDTLFFLGDLQAQILHLGLKLDPEKSRMPCILF